MCCCLDQAGRSGEEGASLQDLPQHGGQHSGHQGGAPRREQGGGGQRQTKKELKVISSRVGNNLVVFSRSHSCFGYVRHVTGNDQDYLRKIPRVVVQKSALL
jgi:hypothetical protein